MGYTILSTPWVYIAPGYGVTRMGLTFLSTPWGAIEEKELSTPWVSFVHPMGIKQSKNRVKSIGYT